MQFQKQHIYGSLGALFLTYTCITYIQKKGGRLYYNENSLKIKQIIEKCSHLKNPNSFTPTFLLHSSLLQTVASTILPINKNLVFNTKSIPCPQNQQIGIKISWPYCKNSRDTTQPENQQHDVIVFILPGLTGQPKDSYINNLVVKCIKQGLQPVVYNYRVFSEDLELKENNKVCLTADLHLTLQELQNQQPNATIYGIGHSYGANQLVNYMGTYKEESIIKGGVSLGNPYSMITSSKHIKGTIYDPIVAWVLKKGLKKVQQPYEKAESDFGFKIQHALQAATVEEFDHNLTINLYGYNSTEEYYTQFGSINRLDSIKYPLLGISSIDDGVCHFNAVPTEKFQSNQNLVLLATKAGGHIGWVQGSIFKMSHWFPLPAVEFIQTLVDLKK